MKILIADDDLITLRLLETIIKRLKYEVILAHDGTEAFRILKESPPDIALLDWIMPGLNGLEICRQLRSDSQTRFIYTILLTANDRTEDITAGLDAGANDYIIKPFDQDELKSRVAVGARVMEYENRLQKMNEELRLYSQHMETLAQERAKQLVQADRMVTLGTMAAGIAHEINNPLTVVQGNIKLMRQLWQKQLQGVVEAEEQTHKVMFSSQMISEMLGSLESGAVRMRNIIDGMRKFSHGKGGDIEPMDLAACVRDALEICLPKTKHQVEIRTDLAEIPFPVKGNPVQITQILVNLIGNAVDALAGNSQAVVTIGLGVDNHKARLSVQDNGPGIEQENLEKLWSPFYTTKPIGKGTGLGLFICHTIAAEHGGQIRVESKIGQGTTFILELPSQEAFEKFLSEKETEKAGTPAAPDHPA